MANLEEQRTRIIVLSEEGYGIREISRELNISRNTVRTWIRRHAREGILEDRRRHNHGVRRLTNEQRVDMQHHYEEHPFTPTRYFAAQHDVCLQTIRNYLHSTGLHYRHYAEKVALTDGHKRARLNFANAYLDYDWTNTIFTDEKTFRSSQHGRLTLWRYDNTRYTEDHVVPNQLSGRISANMWAWMGIGGVGELVHISSRQNAMKYVDLLEESMLPTVRTVYPREDVPVFSYVHDNCRVHTARVVSNWFDLHNDEVTLIPWPSRSPDLNPIENLWGLMGQMWDNRNERTKEAIEQHCNEIWDYLRDNNICIRLIGSMRDRLQAVIDNHGAHTRF